MARPKVLVQCQDVTQSYPVRPSICLVSALPDETENGDHWSSPRKSNFRRKGFHTTGSSWTTCVT